MRRVSACRCKISPRRTTCGVGECTRRRGQFILILRDAKDKWLDEDPSSPARVVKQLVSDGETLEPDLPDDPTSFAARVAGARKVESH